MPKSTPARRELRLFDERAQPPVDRTGRDGAPEDDDSESVGSSQRAPDLDGDALDVREVHGSVAPVWGADTDHDDVAARSDILDVCRDRESVLTRGRPR